MTLLRTLTAAALTAAALALPAAPALAVAVLPCPEGEIGAVVVDENGELAEVCVRRDEIDAAVGVVVGAVTDARDRVVSCTDWFLEHPLPTMIYYPDSGMIEIRRDGGPDMYLVCLLTGEPR